MKNIKLYITRDLCNYEDGNEYFDVWYGENPPKYDKQWKQWKRYKKVEHLFDISYLQAKRICGKTKLPPISCFEIEIKVKEIDK